jgi:AcrR family transcriptional regulator
MTDDRTAARRKRRVAARKAQILEGAARVFAEKGFARATTKEIAEAADVSEGTIYNYFNSKEDVLIGIMTHLGERELRTMQITPDLLEQGLQKDLRSYYEEVLRARQEFVASNKAMLQAVISEMIINQDFAERYSRQLLTPGMDVFEQHVRARVERGHIRAVNVPLVARFFSAMNFGLLGLLLIGDPVIESKWESDELVDELTAFLFNGLDPEEEAGG